MASLSLVCFLILSISLSFVLFCFILGSSFIEASGIGKALPFMKEAGGYGECVYLDYNATTPVYPEVFEAIKPYFSNYFANPVSAHIYAEPCKEAVRQARKNIGLFINALDPENELIFTSCGTESDNLAIHIALHHYDCIKKSIKFLDDELNNNDDDENNQLKLQEINDYQTKLPIVLTCSIEHPAVLKYLRTIESEGKIELIVVPVDSEGVVDIKQIEKNLSRRVALVSIMHCNNEIGTIQPIRLISKAISNYNNKNKTNILFHTDASQSCGKINVDVSTLGVDLLTLVGQKFGAPKGSSVLYVREGINKKPMLIGGHQEKGIRGGTENVAYSVGLGEASRLAYNELNSLIFHLFKLKIRFIELLEKYFEDKFITHIKLNGPVNSSNTKSLKSILTLMEADASSTSSFYEPSNLKAKNDLSSYITQLPNTINVSFKGLNGHQIMTKLAKKVAVSAGAACASANDNSSSCKNMCENSKKALMSQVLQAINLSSDFGLGTLRVSLGRHTTEEEIEYAAKEIFNIVSEMWKLEEN